MLRSLSSATNLSPIVPLFLAFGFEMTLPIMVHHGERNVVWVLDCICRKHARLLLSQGPTRGNAPVGIHVSVIPCRAILCLHVETTLQFPFRPLEVKVRYFPQELDANQQALSYLVHDPRAGPPTKATASL